MRRLATGRFASTLLEVALVAAMAYVAAYAVIVPLFGPGGFELLRGELMQHLSPVLDPETLTHPSVEATLDITEVRLTADPELPVAIGMVQPGDTVEFLAPTGTGVTVLAPNFQQQLGLIGAPVLAGLLTLAALFMLLRVVRTLRAGDPFVPENATRLFVIAGLVGLGGQAAALLVAWGRLGILEHPRVAPYVLREFDVSFLPLPAGLAIAVLAEVFRQGARLRREVEGLV